jgi:integrator complex subunit 1
MVLDPKGPARKPPKESVSLILSAENLFGLSKVFQQSVNPDFMLMTIGQTSRAAIERAFDWVIPVISSVPEIISRLPASASCFLLLRAYGEGGEGKSELRKLSAPLLEHVRKSLTGEFGEADAVRAADLLLTDMADPNPDRRRCARRVLQETLGHMKSSAQLESVVEPDSTGLLRLLQVPHSQAIVSDAIKYISEGLAFERGKVLRALVIALNRFISFAVELNIAGPWNFASILCDTISGRHNVCAEAMDRFPDFRSLAIKVVHDKFQECINVKADTDHGDTENLVLIQLCESTESDDTVRKKVVMPLAVLQSVCVLLSTWKDVEDQPVGPSSKKAIQTLANALMYPYDHQETEVEQLDGVVGATMMNSGDRAVTVEQVSELRMRTSVYLERLSN